MAGSLPMGFAGETSKLVSDRGEAVVFRSPIPSGAREVRRVYVDNLRDFSPREALVQEAVDSMKDSFNGGGLLPS